MNAIEETEPAADRRWLRHSVATLAYRGGKALRGAPPGFAEFRISETTRTPGEILAHLGDLLVWALSMARGGREWHDSAAPPWDTGVEQERTAAPSTCTVQAPQRPAPQPNLVPVSSSASRKTQSSGVSGETLTFFSLPLTRSVMSAMFVLR